MMQNEKSTKDNMIMNNIHTSNYGRIGNTFKMTSSKHREPSGFSNRSKRDISNSHKRGAKMKHKFNSK